MEQGGGRGHGQGRSYRHHQELPLIVELAQLVLDLHRVWGNLVALVSRVSSREEQEYEDRSDH